MLEELFSKLDKPGLVTPVTPSKNPGLPLKPTNDAAVTPVTPVTPEKTKSQTQIKTGVETRSNSSGLDLHYCRQCSNLNSRGYCIKQRFKPVDDMPRNCVDFIASGKPAGLSHDEKKAILRWLTYIGENNPDIVSEVMDYCANDPAYREYYLKRSTEVPQ